MDKKYYKRQFVLYDLGISINKDIQKSYEFFLDNMPNTEGITQITAHYGGTKYIFYTNEKNTILFRYDIENKHFLFDHKNFWIHSNLKDHFHHARNNTIKAMVEHVFKIQVEQSGILYK